ncbi:methyltransferase, partial [Streptomyces sp. SID8385]|nr:methyltransferase [Streptomyces sp. SID8385]
MTDPWGSEGTPGPPGPPGPRRGPEGGAAGGEWEQAVARARARLSQDIANQGGFDGEPEWRE